MVDPNLETQIVSYRQQGFNLLLPSKTIQQFSEFHKPTLEVVELSITDGGDVYPQDFARSVAASQRLSLAKTGLLKLSHAAGLIWNWQETKRIDDGRNRDYVACQAVGLLQRGDGQMIPLKASYELDLEVVEEELRELYENKSRYLKVGPENNQRDASDEEKQAFIERSVKRELLRKRKHKLRLAETGAMLAVIRALLGIKATYSKAELAKPFVVQRLVFSPDTSDPEIRRAILSSGIKALTQAYGPTPNAVAPAIELPLSGSHENHENGEFDKEETKAEALEPSQGAQGTDGPEPPQGRKDPEPPQSAEPELPVKLEQEEAFGEMPAVPTVINGVEDLLKMAEADQPKAIRELMARKKYPDKLLKNPKIEEWAVPLRQRFVEMLVKHPDKATEGTK